MKAAIIVLCILVLFLAVVVQQVFQRLINLPVPEGLPENSTWPFKLTGFCFGLAKDLVSERRSVNISERETSPFVLIDLS